MEFFPPGKLIDFMRYRRVCAWISGVLVLASVVAIFYPGLNYGIDFKGGTEVELEFEGKVTSGELRKAVEALGYDRPEVVAVEGATVRFIVRTQEVSSLPKEQVARMESALRKALGDTKVESLKVSPGGDKLSLRLSAAAEPEVIRQALEKAGANVRSVTRFGQLADNRFEAALVGVGDELVGGLREKLGKRAPAAALRVEWVGPKAGRQLRDAAIQAMLYALAFILVYVAFRFDLRFAPGGIVALLHDAAIVAGCYALLQKEFTLATVAAILTVVGYSINDTIVIYDRIRENLQKRRDTGLYQLINLSTSETLSRTIITSGATMLAMLGFFVWGTPMIKDITFALTVGFISGSYSTIFIAAPLTEWIDRRFFQQRA